NVPPENAPYDMRFLHLNATWILALATYVQATGDLSILDSKHAYWVGTDGEEPQPLVGKKAEGRAYLLPAGDVRLDKKAPEKVHTLGQSFKAEKSFKRVEVRLGTEGTKEDASGRIWFSKSPDGDPIAERDFTLPKGSPIQTVSLELEETFEPGMYFVGIQDHDSGKRYFGPGIYWVADLDSKEDAPPAMSGPFQGDLHDRMKLLFDYLYEHTGVKRENLSHYQDDREYNVPQQKSGRVDSMQNSFWECLGGVYDAFAALWYNAACTAMADIATRLGDTEDAKRYQDLRVLADDAYNQKFWTTVEENEKTFSRYTGAIDWDGKSWDFGFTYYNLEAADRGIASPTQARDILWWLDRGQWTRDNQTWNDHIYSIWDIAAPFNTINNETWIGITGTLPYMHVLTNGGTRMDIAARDLTVRAKYLSIDNMHERMKRVLGRFSSPDRLTGGRTYDDPGGRGRWHFGTPNEDRADIEGFREIFPQNGVLATAIVRAYLGWEYDGEGLKLRPRVPSDFSEYTFEDIGYSGALLDFHVRAERQPVEVKKRSQKSSKRLMFSAADSFNRVGLQCRVQPFENRRNSEISLSLQKMKEDGDWEEVAVNWYNHVSDQQWVWVTADEDLDPSDEYRIEVSHLSAPEGEDISIVEREDGQFECQLESETTHLQIEADLVPEGKFSLERVSGNGDSIEGLTATMGPGESLLLRKTNP
ncbi:MAG: hypothetical protein KC940_22780, partial [Candidatus Omnitrophica bacterium]|nr:hypothetical protein [Candidatus Omnitrophota bacterium]